MVKLLLQQSRQHCLKAFPCLLLMFFSMAHQSNSQSPATATAPAAASAAKANPAGSSISSQAGGPLQTADAPVISPVTQAYVLQPADAVQISVFNEPDLSVTVRLSADGTIMYPLIGRVALSGLTVQQAQDIITRKLGEDYLVNPQVTMTVMDYTKKYFTVLGQVAKPGPYEIPAEGRVTLLQAVGMAGGFTRIANASHITIKRKTGDKQYKIIKTDAKKLVKDGSADDLQIQGGDTITVPESWF